MDLNPHHRFFSFYGLLGLCPGDPVIGMFRLADDGGFEGGSGGGKGGGEKGGHGCE